MNKDNKRLIPFSIKNIDNNKWSITVDDNEPFEIEGDESQIRKVLLRTKTKDGDGKKSKRSSKNGTYLNMCDGETHYMWKSKAFHNEEEFKSLMENKCVNYAKDVFEKAMKMSDDEATDYIFSKLNKFSDEDILSALDEYCEDVQVGSVMVNQLPPNKHDAYVMNEDKLKFIPSDIYSKIKGKSEDEMLKILVKELPDFSEEEISDFIDKL